MSEKTNNYRDAIVDAVVEDYNLNPEKYSGTTLVQAIKDMLNVQLPFTPASSLTAEDVDEAIKGRLQASYEKNRRHGMSDKEGWQRFNEGMRVMMRNAARIFSQEIAALRAPVQERKSLTPERVDQILDEEFDENKTVVTALRWENAIYRIKQELRTPPPFTEQTGG